MGLQIDHLIYSAGEHHLSIHQDFSGTICGIFGPSGAGKTTLLELIAGFRKLDQGRIRLQDKVLADSSRKIHLAPRHRNIGYVPQDLALFPHLSVEANLKYGANLRKHNGSGPSFSDTVKILELEPLLKRTVDHLSGGEKQRVAFGRGILACPELLLMDEPLSSLNRQLRLRIRKFIARIREEFRIPIILVSHDSDDVLALCDSVSVLEDGKLIRTGDPRTVLTETDEYG